MEILVTESIAGAAQTASEQLEAAGHRVHRCHADAETAFPCVGLVSECPLDGESVDLVLAVRPRVQTRPTDDEIGITCGLRRRIPVAIAGQTLMNPFGAFGAEAIDGDLVDECERIAASRRPGHEAVAVEVARTALAASGYATEPSDVSVQRIDGRLRVRVFVPEEVPEPAREIVAVRVVGRLRAFDPYAAGIDIGVTTMGSGS
jgi:hypothetical protein